MYRRLITTIITIFTTIQGLNEYVIGQLSNIGSSTVYVEKWPWVIRGDFWRYRNRKNVTYKEYEALEKFSKQADYIAPAIMTFKTVKYKNNVYERVPVVGTNDQYNETDNVLPATGRFLTTIDVHRNHKVCVLGDDVANNLFKEESPIGKRIKVGPDKYRVVGVNEKRGKVFGQSMDNYVIVPFGTFQGAFSRHRGMRISMTVKNVEKLEEMKDEIRGIMRKVRKIPPENDDDFAIGESKL